VPLVKNVPLVLPSKVPLKVEFVVLSMMGGCCVVVVVVVVGSWWSRFIGGVVLSFYRRSFCWVVRQVLA
jgi:hypothetical protein